MNERTSRGLLRWKLLAPLKSATSRFSTFLAWGVHDMCKEGCAVLVLLGNVQSFRRVEWMV